MNIAIEDRMDSIDQQLKDRCKKMWEDIKLEDKNENS